MAEKSWKRAYNSVQDMTVVYTGWDHWLIEYRKELKIWDEINKIVSFGNGEDATDNRER
jgi:hypothetical protein